MIAIVIAATQCIVVGLAAALLLEPAMTPRRLLGTAYLLGIGICAFILLTLSLLGILWSATSFTLAFCIVAVALWMAALKIGGRASRPLAPDILPGALSNAAGQDARQRRARRPPPFAWVVDACTALLVIGHGVYASLVRGDVWDFWAIWGLKARVFFEDRGIDWRFLEHPYNAFAHPDYPPLLPLHFAHVTLLGGEWNERWLGILTTLFGAALLLVVRDLFEEELQRPVAAALATLAVASPAFSMIGVGDGPMIAYGTAALLTIRRGSLAAGAVLLGLAAFAKNEGIVLVIAAALALRGAGVPPARAGHPARRPWLRLWPAAAIAAPWLILRAVHSLPSDIVSGALSERLWRNLAELPGALAATLPDRPLFWLAIAITLAVFVREWRSERFVLGAVILQLLAYLAAYAVTPYDVHWHVRSSWPRLVTHLAVPLAFVALLVSARAALRASDLRTRSAAG